MNHSPNILIYRLGSIGDTIIALPCFHKIRELYPNSNIVLLTNKPVASKAAPIETILGKHYFIDNVIDYPLNTRNPFVIFSLIRKIISFKINIVINITAIRTKKSIQRDKWFFRMAGINKFIGFPSSHREMLLLIDQNTGEFEWEAKRLVNRIKELGEIPLNEDKYWDLKLTNLERQQANEILNNSTFDSPILAISAGTKVQSKDWGEHNWLTLIQQLKNKYSNYRLIMIGSTDESPLAKKCINIWGDAGINLCGRVSPRVSAAILEKSFIFIGHDSGPMHLAACVGTPCVAIFSARNLPRQWFPRGLYNEVLYNLTDCAGCNLDICIDQKKKCILSISVNEVMRSICIVQDKINISKQI